VRKLACALIAINGFAKIEATFKSGSKLPHSKAPCGRETVATGRTGCFATETN
jgi:hypothetical protein